MRFSILGPLEVRGELGVVALGGIKLRAALAMLLLHANEPVNAERLALALWGEDVPGEATKTVHVYVSRLRRALGDRDVIETTPAGYRLRVRNGELDVALFERLAEDGRRALASGEYEHARDVLGAALGLWRGPTLAEFAGEPFAVVEIARLEEQRLAVLEARVEADLAVGRHGELVGELRQLVAGHPTRERLAGDLMLALYRCGRQADALEVYHHARRRLVDDVGIEPGPRLRELQEAILRHDAVLDWRDGVRKPTAAHAKRVVLALPRALDTAASGPFVGRDGELAWLRGRWQTLQHRGRSAVVVAGEPGIGKTRLASELARELHRDGALVLYGRCDEGLAVPFQPFLEALAPYARAVGAEWLRGELGVLASQLGRLLPELAGPGELARGEPESERYALFDAVAALLEVMTRTQHVLLIVDDVHWAARPTLQLLRHLIRCERPLRLLIITSYRETDVNAGHPLGQLLADLHRDASAEHVRVGGLDRPAITALLKASTGQPLDEQVSELASALEAQTAGNPFFIRELLAHLAESGTISTAGARVSGDATAAQLEVPEGLRNVIVQRIARLSASAQRALGVAAVAGPTFSFALLDRVLGDRDGLPDALDEAAAAGLLTAAEHPDYAFAHALVRQTLYRELGSARRTRLHRQLGEALEALGHGDTHVEALARHFAHAAADGHGDKAAGYALAAGRKAAARLGYEEAAGHYERGLLALNAQGHDRHRCELLLALGEARWGTGQPEEARQAHRQAAELADTLGDVTALAHAALGFSGPFRLEVDVTLHGPITAMLEQALAALGAGDSPLRARLLARLAARTEHGSPVLAREALQMARRVGDHATLADVLNSYLWATRGPDTLHESLAMTRELRRLAAELGQSRLEATARGWLLDLLLELGDIDGVDRELEALQRFARTRQDRYISSLLAMRQAGHAHLRGHLDDCEILARNVLAHQCEGPEIAAMVFVAQMCFVRREQGRLEELVDDVEGCAERCSHLGPGWRCGLASIYAALGRTERAQRELDGLAYASFDDLPRDMFWLSDLSVLSQLVAGLGDAARARPLYTMLLPYADRCAIAGPLPSWGSASRPLGLLATTLARYDDAERHFEHALKINAQIRSPLWIAHTQHDYARMLLLRNHPSDRDKALQLLTEVLTTAHQLGLTALADTARRLRPAAQAVAPTPEP